MNNNTTSHKKNNKIWFSLTTLILAAVTIIMAVHEAPEFRQRLDETGLYSALTGSPLVITLAGFTLIFSVLYLISYWRVKRLNRKHLIRLAKQAEEAKARGEEFVLPSRSTGARVGSTITKVLDVLTKLVIAAFVLALIGAGTYTGLKADEFNNRPVYNVLDGVDITSCVTGYNGMGYVDEEQVVYTNPKNVADILRTSKNYKESRDYSPQQEVWAQFLDSLDYTITPDTTGGGTLANGDEITVTTGLTGYDLNKLQAQLGIKLEGIGDSKSSEVTGLPYKYEDTASLLDEKSDIIKAAYDKLKLESYKKYNSFKSSSLTGFTYDGAYLLKPEHNEASEPDALLLMAHTEVDPNTEYSSMHTMAIYVYPFDSRTEAADIDADTTYDKDQIKAQVEFFEYNYTDKVLASFETGIYFSALTGYDLTELPWSEPVAE